MLRRTKNFLNAYGVEYEKEHVNPLMVPGRVYVLKFGKRDGEFLNRFIVEHSYTWTGRDKINKITLRLHGQRAWKKLCLKLKNRMICNYLQIIRFFAYA